MRASIHADEGQGQPLVYLPGVDGTGELLLGTAPRLAERYRLVRLQYRSEGPDTYGELARSVVQCLDEAGIERAVLLSESFGGAVAMQTALDAPERVSGIALVNSFPRYAWRVRLAVSRLGAFFMRPWMFGAGRRWGVRLVLFGKLAESEAVQAFVDLGGHFDAGYAARLHMIAGLDLRSRLGEITQPVLLVASARDWIVDSVPQAERMRDAVADAQLQVVPEGGHVILPVAGLPWVEWIADLVVRADAIPADPTQRRRD